MFLIYPVQLFENLNTIKKLLQNNDIDKICLLEDPVYFTKYKFHKMKLIYHRATMQYYNDYLAQNLKNVKIKYVNYDKVDAFYKKLSNKKSSNNKKIYCFDPVDVFVRNKLRKISKNTILLDTPMFLNTIDELIQYKGSLTSDNYHHDSSFYRWQRKNLDVLMNKKGKPQGGHWTYDSKNRNKFPSDYKEPKIAEYDKTKSLDNYFKEAENYVSKNFSKNKGNTFNDVVYPIDHKTAKSHFKSFLKNKLQDFGEYQDAIDSNVIFGNHSVISCILNCGLITPKYVVDKTLKYGEKSSNKVPMNSLEGFLRQVIGWREYVRFIYEFEEQNMRGANYMNSNNKMNSKWWSGKTGLTPLDNVINKVDDYCYAHHIERLMILGNCMLLCQIHPDDVFDWFISFCSIDAYDWVMVPNIYGMSQYADGGIMMSRPYFSSSNYIAKMSDYKKSEDWAEIWDALYYYFIFKKSSKLSKIYSTANSVKLWEKKDKKEQNEIKKIASNFIISVTL